MDHFESLLNLLQNPFYVLFFWLGGSWNLSSPTRDRTCTPGLGRRNPNHWSTRKVPKSSFEANEEQLHKMAKYRR